MCAPSHLLVFFFFDRPFDDDCIDALREWDFPDNSVGSDGAALEGHNLPLVSAVAPAAPPPVVLPLPVDWARDDPIAWSAVSGGSHSSPSGTQTLLSPVVVGGMPSSQLSPTVRQLKPPSTPPTYVRPRQQQIRRKQQCASAPGASPPCDVDCFLCHTKHSTSNPVNVGDVEDLQGLWIKCAGSYKRLAPALLCPSQATNHKRCRNVVRALIKCSMAAMPILDGKACCYPIELLDAYLAPGSAWPAHRRCRGGLQSLLQIFARLIEVGADHLPGQRVREVRCRLVCVV